MKDFSSRDLNEFHRNKLFKCSKKAENVHEHARCVVAALDAQEARKRFAKIRSPFRLLDE